VDRPRLEEIERLALRQPSTTSVRTTSASSRSTMYCAVVAPTFPAPTTVTFGLAISPSGSGLDFHTVPQTQAR
jgi:hypothetical protein